ncbi:MAG: retropepsin-like aspartic protease [Candidatus Micrarchaeota archaeon]
MFVPQFIVPYTKLKLQGKDWYFPKVQITLKRMGKTFNTDALIDSGADYSLFRHEIAEALGLPLERGAVKTIKGISGEIKTYAFNMEVDFGGESFNSPIEFSRDYKFRYNLLGRMPFFEKFRITFDEKNKQMIFEKNE